MTTGTSDMHTYRKYLADWQVVFHDGTTSARVGPNFGVECEAAAFASFLNGGRYNPYEIEAVFAVRQDVQEDADSIHPDRPKAFDNDYPIAATQRYK